MGNEAVKKGVFYLSIAIIVISVSVIGYFGYLYINTPPVVDFDYQQVAAPGQEVTFLNTSTIERAANQWTWDFGDQSPVVQSVSAKHTFPVPGRYVITLQLALEGEVITKQNIIQVNQAPPKSSFDVEASTVVVGDTLNISNNSQNADFFIWTLGDGRTSNNENPAISYLKAGTYDLKLLAINDLGQKDEYVLNVNIERSGADVTLGSEDEVIVKHIPIFNQETLSQALSQLANTGFTRSEKRKIRNDILRDVASINILVNDITLENYLNKVQLEASSNKVIVNVSSVERDANNKISKITVN